MARPKLSTQLTPLELEIMMVLWQKTEGASVQIVQDGLPDDRNLTYSTVQTMLNLLVKKGKATRTLDGRAFICRPAEARSSAMRTALKDIIDRMFGGSAEDLVVGLVETRQLDADKLAKLHKLLKPGEGRTKGSD